MYKRAKLIALRPRLELLCLILQKIPSTRTADEEDIINKIISFCALEIYDAADVVFTTCINSTSDWLGTFRDMLRDNGTLFVDETSAMVESELLVVMKGDVEGVLAGDPAQLGLCVAAARAKVDDFPVGAFCEQLGLPGLTRMKNIGFPLWLIPEQLRIEPGGFDLANSLLYNNQITYHPSLRISSEAAAFETYTTSSEITFNRRIGNHLQQKDRQSPPGKVLPVFLGANKNVVLFHDSGRKICSYFIHMGRASEF